MEVGRDPELSPKKKHPKLSSTTETLTHPPYPTDKGKEKIAVVVDWDRDQDQRQYDNGGGGRRTCGICLVEEGPGSIRGEVDSCVHYFCFVCIMEWSKVESRCPLCKQRFLFIRRPPVPGVFPAERIVRVPERNQVYHPLGNVSEGPEDLYADVCCSFCQNSSNDNLLLLCDLCDSAAHTYCIGLGYDVPEGDWYCDDCMISKNEHSKFESDNDGRYSCDNLGICRRSQSPVSITEIVAEDDPYISPQPSFCATDCGRIGGTGLRSNRLDTAVDLHDCSSCPESFANGRITMSKSVFAPISNVTGQAGRTLRRCRDVHGHIQRLRENWNDLRTGSLTFGFISSRTGGSQKTGRKRTDPSISRPRPLATPARAPQTTQDKVPDVPACCTSSSDVDKAWRMMKAAKSVQQMVKQDKGCAPSNKDQHTRLIISRARSAGVKPVDRILNGIDQGHISPRVEETELKFLNDHMKRHGSDMIEKLQVHKECQRMDKESCCLTPAIQKQDIANRIVHDRREDKTSVGGSNTCPCPGPDTFIPFLGSLVSNSNKLGCNELLPHEKEPTSKERLVAGKDDASSSKVTSSNAKSEVQSIVKLNLKLQRIDKCLGSEGFKKVARVATHTILAACGLEHSESIARKVPKMICKHSEQVEHVRHSKLMPGSCRECFYTFVSDVVANISSELMA